ncbi:MAG: LysR family transcriptional regulator [Polyangiaceae bacterium]|nr:LysR family transcriptional regulator [Polyangiaceae bacterium]
MKLSQRATQIWNWLPAFRAVAEAEHLPTASKEVHLSPSALSRAVRLLEDDLGVELFVREGRQLELTEAGRRLLGASRSAMRSVEAALDQVLSAEATGDVRVSAPGPYCSVFVLPALRRLRDTFPEVVPHLSSVSGNAAERLLAEGGLDIAIVDGLTLGMREGSSNGEGPASSRGSQLRVTKLGELGYSVYAGADHPLVAELEVTVDDVLAHPFVAAPEHLIDHWPPDLSRRIGMVVEQLHVAVQACALDGMLAVLPDVVANAYRGEGELVRLPVDIVRPQPLYAVSRRAAVEPKRINVVLTAIVQTFADVSRGGPRRSSLPPPRSTLRPPPIFDRSLASPRAPTTFGVPGGFGTEGSVPPSSYSVPPRAADAGKRR